MKTKEKQNVSIINPDLWYKLNAKEGKIVTEFDSTKKGRNPLIRKTIKKINSILLRIIQTLNQKN